MAIGEDTGESVRFDAEALAAAFGEWWRDAGVDHDYLDEPRDWLAEAAAARPEPAADAPGPSSEPAPIRKVAPPPPPPAEKMGGPREKWPQALAGFTDWWLSEPTLDAIGTTGRVAPLDRAGADAMILVAEPERADTDSLLSGPDGQLLDAMLRAMGTGRDDVALISALPRHTPMADWDAIGAAGMDAVLRHHVALARPRRLFVFGRDVVGLLALETFDPAEGTGLFRKGDIEIPVMAGHPLGAMARRPQFKAQWWRRFMAFSNGSDAKAKG